MKNLHGFGVTVDRETKFYISPYATIEPRMNLLPSSNQTPSSSSGTQRPRRHVSSYTHIHSHTDTPSQSIRASPRSQDRQLSKQYASPYQPMPPNKSSSHTMTPAITSTSSDSIPAFAGPAIPTSRFNMLFAPHTFHASSSTKEDEELSDTDTILLSPSPQHQSMEARHEEMNSSAFNRRYMSSPIAQRPAKRRRMHVSQVTNSGTNNESESEGDTITVEVPKPDSSSKPESRTKLDTESDSKSDSEPEPEPEAEQSNLTTRPRTRRQAALKSLSSTRSQYIASPEPASTSKPKAKNSNGAKATSKTQAKPKGKECGKGKEKEKTKGQSQSTGKSKSKAESKSRRLIKQEEEKEEDEDEDYECPCGYGCSTISFCEGRKKEIECRDVGMSVILSCKAMITILVGTAGNQESFIIHKDLLSLHSEYFARLFRFACSRPSASTTSKSLNTTSPTIAERNAVTPAGDKLPSTEQEAAAEEKFWNSFARNKISSVKTEEAEDSDEDIGMISSDQYYAMVSNKKPFTPEPTPTKPAQNPTTTYTPSSPGYSPTSPSPYSSNTNPDPTTTHTLPPSILPLPFSLFTSYIYTGALSPSLLLLTDTLDSCSWERLWVLGYQLGSPGFMNFCMEGLRELKVVREGRWPRVKDVFGIWAMESSLPSLPHEVNADADASSKSESEAVCKGGESPARLSPLHRFTAACIAHNAPLSSLAKNTPEYNAWTRVLSGKAEAAKGLGIAVLGVERELIAEGKKPWDDEFREKWKVEEGGLMGRWKDMVDMRKDGEMAGGIEGRGSMKESVKALLEGMAIEGKSGLDDLGDNGSDEESSERGCRSGSEESEVEVFEEDGMDADEGEEDRYERLDGRYKRYGRRSRK
ncbi:hypothetical protein VTL71DRAFT_13231 [Oculimacula yallundae]|uniref:BTB domain-containing protein n=1 Tax=Oculimacula yallundae TaxID=86028 RepID=A0ABR4CJR8_9HELO